MASVTKKINWVKCVKSAGIVTCDGCQQPFCSRHVFDHRQELFQQDLTQENDTGSTLFRIDTWENESIAKT